MRLGVALALTLVSCSPRPPATLVWEGAGAPRAEAVTDVAARLREASTGVRRGPWGDAEDSTLQLLETDRPEESHIHARHDLTVVMLSGRGSVQIEERRYDLRAGDVLHIGRGKVHALYPEGAVTGLAIFTPRLEGPDYVPASMKNAPENDH